MMRSLQAVAQLEPTTPTAWNASAPATKSESMRMLSALSYAKSALVAEPSARTGVKR